MSYSRSFKPSNKASNATPNSDAPWGLANHRRGELKLRAPVLSIRRSSILGLSPLNRSTGICRSLTSNPPRTHHLEPLQGCLNKRGTPFAKWDDPRYDALQKAEFINAYAFGLLHELPCRNDSMIHAKNHHWNKLSKHMHARRRDGELPRKRT